MMFTQDAELGQRAIGHSELAGLLAGEHVAERGVALCSLLIMHHGVAVAEGAALAILPAQAHMVACTKVSSLWTCLY